MALVQERQLAFEPLDFLLALFQCLGHTLGVVALRDEIDEVVPRLDLLFVFDLPLLNGVGRLGELLGHHFLHLSEHEGEGIRLRKHAGDLAENDPFGDRLLDDDSIGTPMLCGPVTTVIPTALAGDFDDGCAADAAEHGAGQQLLGVDGHPVPICALETCALLAPRPNLFHLRKSFLDAVPKFIGYDPEFRHILHEPLAPRLFVLVDLTREGISFIPHTVPGPGPLVFLVPQDSVNLSRSPHAGPVLPAANFFLVELFLNAENGFAVREISENPTHYICFTIVDHHQLAGGNLTSPLVDACFGGIHGFVPECTLADEVPLVFPPFLAAQGLRAKIL